jgi:hypothetical protein
MADEKCELCGCDLHRKGGYAKPTVKGRSHATKHHYVAERLFGRSKNRPGTTRTAIFEPSQWQVERKTAIFCYECHEELIHNPVFLPEDVKAFANLIRSRKLHESNKTSSRDKLAGRIKLLHEVIQKGLTQLRVNIMAFDKFWDCLQRGGKTEEGDEYCVVKDGNVGKLHIMSPGNKNKIYYITQSKCKEYFNLLKSDKIKPEQFRISYSAYFHNVYSSVTERETC